MFDLFSFVVAESDFLQHSEPSFMETTTIEMDPVTQERYIYKNVFFFKGKYYMSFNNNKI